MPLQPSLINTQLRLMKILKHAVGLEVKGQTTCYVKPVLNTDMLPFS